MREIKNEKTSLVLPKRHKTDFTQTLFYYCFILIDDCCMFYILKATATTMKKLDFVLNFSLLPFFQLSD